MRSPAACLIILALSGCDCRGSGAAGGPDGIPIGGWYRAEIRAESGEAIPFFLSLPADHETATARIVTGEQELFAPHVWSGPRLDIEFPIYRTHIEAAAREDGTLEGSFHHESLAFGDSELTLTAEPVDDPDPEARFSASGDPPDELPARWRLRFENTGDAELLLDRRGESAVEGALRLESGNVIYLAGNVRGDELALSGFDGSSPYLLRATLDRTSALDGSWIAGPGLRWREAVAGAADAEFEITPKVALSPGTHRLPVPELGAEPYAGSPVILVLTGSWSPASIRAVPFLTELFEEHRDAGLEILALNYELTSDEAYNDAVAEAINAAHDVPWTIVPIDGTAEEYAAIVPAGLESIDVQSFPVLVFIGRDGLVRDVRAGFPPEAAAELHAATVADYRALTAALVDGEM